ncbi:hypothetical protein [Thalassotalea sp. Y01]|uniref:hypothetical protein n=1 Tax=Thalassotalea sp. Y01 TaxID=2729613 RepID=UPI00145E7495|nr:hypothetical protein [Thalassotalea sp. Y01]NMP16615.1 hypothetical protein [Thalassotalea sp. Y01]
MNDTLHPAPKWFAPVAVVALIWNLMGVMAYLMGPVNNADVMSSLSDAQQAFYQTMPTWAMTAFAIAVFAGSLGCLMLALRKRLAIILLLLSLLGVIVQNVHTFMLNDGVAIFGQSAMVMPLLVIIIAVALLYLAKHANQKNWLD